MDQVNRAWFIGRLQCTDTYDARVDSERKSQVVEKNGAGKVIRTPDPIITNDVLYQLSYTGILIWIVVAIPGSALRFSQGRPRRPDAAFAGPKRCFGACRLTQLSYTGIRHI